MKELHLQGWLSRDSDGMPALKQDISRYGSESIPHSIESFADIKWDYEDWLGGTESVIPNANLRMYICDKECSLDEAVEALLLKFDGKVETNISLAGYSECTITGYDCEKFTIGGHDLDAELSTYMKKYIHLVLEC